MINSITSTQLQKVEPEKGIRLKGKDAGRSSDGTTGADVDVDEAYACGGNHCSIILYCVSELKI